MKIRDGVRVTREVTDVKEVGDNTHITVEGFVSGDGTNKETIVLIVNPETKIIDSEKLLELHKEREESEKSGEAKDFHKEIENLENAEIKKGDTVEAFASKAMTKSMPAQTVAKFIKVTTAK